MVFPATPSRLIWASGIATAILLLQVSVAQEVHTGFPGLDQPQPSVTECRAHIEAALKKLGQEDDTSSSIEASSLEGGGSSEEVAAGEQEGRQVLPQDVTSAEGTSAEGTSAESTEGVNLADILSAEEPTPVETAESTESTEAAIESNEASTESTEAATESMEASEESNEAAADTINSQEATSAEVTSTEQEAESPLVQTTEAVDSEASAEVSQEGKPSSEASSEEAASTEKGSDEVTSAEVSGGEVSSGEVVGEEPATVSSEESATTQSVDASDEEAAPAEEGSGESVEVAGEAAPEGSTEVSGEASTESGEVVPEAGTSAEEVATSSEEGAGVEEGTSVESVASSEEGTSAEAGAVAEEVASEEAEAASEEAEAAATEGEQPEAAKEEVDQPPEEELSADIIIPTERRNKDHIHHVLQLDEGRAETDLILSKVVDSTLKDLKRVYDNAIKPLEILYKYRDLSNRHFGDPEIFSKPLILFMGPWSGGKSTIINYLMDIEYTHNSLRTGAEPSPAYFNILMWGDHEEVLDGTQLAADWTFSGLQKFGQGLLDRLRGLRLPNKLLEKVNIVEIPGILEIRKQVERHFPFNDACQWFIDRADIIFLVYDPSKLDVGPETEAILDQLKGREYQVRMILNKADQVKPEELMRVQGTLIWNISPLMSSSEPPIMYSTSLWSLPYEVGAPTRLLYAQELAFLRDIRTAVEKRVENKIASARRFAVRVRNHAKMVDCYLTTYYNHKSIFGNKKRVSDDIIEHPQDYHIYEGLSTLTNISRYDLPDPEVYRDFFKLNALYDFQLLSSTCTYFKGCPINKLDISIAYDLPELVGKYKRAVDTIVAKASKES